MDEERRKTHQHLESEVQERTAELRQAYERLEKELAERKRAEEELTRLASFPKLNPDPVIEIDLDGVATYLNPAARKEFPDLLTGGDKHPVLISLKSALTALQSKKKKYLRTEIELGNKVYEQRLSYIPESRHLRSYIEDITERKQAEEKTKQLQGYLQLQIERMPVGLITWDTEFRVQSWNPAAEKIFGFKAAEALGKHSYDLIVPKEAQPYVDDIWRRLLEGDTTAHSVNENIAKDGRTIICDWSNTPLKEADGTMAGVLSMVQDITERKQAEEKVKAASLDTIYRLSRAAEYRDEETGAHIQRMSRYSAAVAGQMGLDDHMVENILYAAPMHDIGKIGIPDRILLRPGKLDPDEWDIMKQHTTIGAKILAGSDAEFIRLGGVIALTHHERWDGKGYPKGLKGSEIPLVGRITAIADVLDARISKRPYNEAFPVEKSLAIIRENRGSHFDPEVADAFFAISDEILAIKKKYPSLGESPLIRLANKST